MFTLITGIEQHENGNYWYRTTQKHSIICTGVVALASPAARTINYHLVCFLLIWQFSTDDVGLYRSNYPEWFHLGFIMLNYIIKQ